MILADEIANEIVKSSYFCKLFRKSMELSLQEMLNLEVKTICTEKEYHDLLRFADLLSISSFSQARNYAYNIITYLNSRFKNDPYYRTVSKSVYYNLGNFPAVKYLTQIDSNNAELPFDKMVQVEAKKMIQEVPNTTELFFTDTQYDLFISLSRAREYSFSGPTSMGKSFIIKAFLRRIINNKPPENLVIMVPTRALINQFAIEIKQELGKQLEKNNYTIVTNSNVSELLLDGNVNMILILTPERLISYLSQNENPAIGFLFVDEAHKIAQNDTRSITTYVAIEKTLKKYPTTKLYFSSPNITNPEILLSLFQKTEQNSFKSDETTVTQNIFFVDLETKELAFYDNDDFIPVAHVPEKASTINGFLSVYGKDSNLVYCNTVAHTIEYAINYAETIKLEDNQFLNNSTLLKKASQIIGNYIHRDYYLTEIIKKGVAYHFGNMPQLIRNLIEDLYKKGEIKYIFCTSTLLEGVNMPTQNLFILDNRKSTGVLKSIDFWNLAGRAGRLAKELQGNVFCIKTSECSWENRSFLKEKETNLVPTVFDRINHNLKKIENQIKCNEIKSGTEEEKNILRYIANIICIDTMELKTGYQSPIIKQLINNNKDEIIRLAESKNKEKNICTPFSLLDSNESIDIDIQDSVYKQILKAHSEKKDLKLPSTINYKSCLYVLDCFHRLYDWEHTNKTLSKKNSMKYYAMLMNQWINGVSLNQIISASIDYYSKSQTIQISHGKTECFDSDNKKHINKLIDEIIRDIEKILRFQFEKYFNHYHLILKHIIGDENVGENWATLLEYGTLNRIVIALQNLGLSRYTANKVYDIYKNNNTILIIEKGKLKKVDKCELLNHMNNDTLEYEEITSLL